LRIPILNPALENIQKCALPLDTLFRQKISGDTYLPLLPPQRPDARCSQAAAALPLLGLGNSAAAIEKEMMSRIETAIDRASALAAAPQQETVEPPAEAPKAEAAAAATAPATQEAPTPRKSKGMI
jgi:hypothetical protein